MQNTDVGQKQVKLMHAQVTKILQAKLERILERKQSL